MPKAWIWRGVQARDWIQFSCVPCLWTQKLVKTYFMCPSKIWHLEPFSFNCPKHSYCMYMNLNTPI